MNNISHELALIVCKQTERLENESDVDFSKRLYSVYQTCKSTISSITTNKDNNFYNNAAEEYLKITNK